MRTLLFSIVLLSAVACLQLGHWTTQDPTRETVVTLDPSVGGLDSAGVRAGDETHHELFRQVRIDGVDQTVRLRPHSMRAASFSATVMGEQARVFGTKDLPVRTFRGSLDGDPSMLVAALIRAPRHIELDVIDQRNGDAWTYSGPDSADTPLDLREHQYEPWPCGCDALNAPYLAVCSAAPLPMAAQTTFPSPAPPPPSTETKILALAFEVDNHTYSSFGGDFRKIQDHLDHVLNISSLFWETTLGVGFEWGSGFIYETEALDPYESMTFQSVFGMAQDGQEHWEADLPDVVRDCVVVFHDNPNGNEYYGAALPATYLASPICHGVNDDLVVVRCTEGFSNIFTAVVLAHEIGHQMGSIHDDEHPHPADSDCYSGSGEYCVGVASLMGNDRKLWLCPESQAHFECRLESMLCGQTDPVYRDAPSISSIWPAEIQVLNPKPLRIMGSWNDAFSVSIGDHSYRIDELDFYNRKGAAVTPAFIAAPRLGTLDVRLEGPGGFSQVHTVDYVATWPPRIYNRAGSAASGYTYPLLGTLVPPSATWTFGGLPRMTADVLKTTDPSTTTTIDGHTVLEFGQVVHTVTLDSLGLGSYTESVEWGDPDIFLQVLLYDSQGTLRGVSNISANSLFL